MPERPLKRLKTAHTTYASPEDIRAALKADDPTQALISLRNQFAVWPTDGLISTHDPRLLLAQKWLDASSGVPELFAIWEKSAANVRQPGQIVLVVSLLSSLLALFNSHYTFHPSGLPALRTLLTPLWMKRLNSYLGGSHNELLLVTLKLFNAVSAYGRGKERKALLESFAWETKSLPKLLNMRRKGKTDDSADALARPDIRTSYILFCLSFVEQDTIASVKTIFLEQHRDVFFSIFRALAQDPFVVIRRVLEICWGGIWMDLKLKRTLKLGLFGEITVSHLLKIYERSSAEDDNPENIPADVAHHFLLAICTRPGLGICFKDKGWYPRTSDTPEDEDDRRPRDRAGKIHNKILANILKTLQVNEDSRQQELALKIMSACPELVAGYWSSVGLTLEPRLSSKWIANIAFFSSVLALPIPTASFLADNGVLYHPTPPPLSAVLENTFPSVGTKNHFSKGLQQPSGLVQHCTALALCKCLAKYTRVLEIFRTIESALDEDEADGQWAKLRRDLEREVRHRVPEFQVIIAFASKPAQAQADPTKAALLAECAQRLMWMYHSCLPQIVAESRFDIGKLVQNLSELAASTEGEERDPAARLNVVRQLHVLRLLNTSEQFQWSGKATSGKTHLHVLLDAYCSCDISAVQQTIRNLLVNLLSQSVIFENSPDEASLWISSIPLGSEETTTVVSFLEDCIQRCVKSPERYIDAMNSLGSTRGDLTSPLIMTVLEKQDAPSLFLQRLIIRLSSVQSDLSFLNKVVDKLENTSVDKIRAYLPCRHVEGAINDLTLPFEELFVSASVLDIAQKRDVLVGAVTASIAALKQAVCLIGHSLEASEDDELTSGLLCLLTALCRKAMSALSVEEVSEFKEALFVRSLPLVRLCTSTGVSEPVVEAIAALIKSALDPAKSSDRDVVANITSHWITTLVQTDSSSRACSPWIAYMEPQDLFNILRTLGQEADPRRDVLETTIAALEGSVKSQPIPDIHAHLDLLTSLRPTLPNSAALESMIGTVINSCVPVGISGRPLNLSDVSTEELLSQADAAWARRSHLRDIASLDLRSFLYQERPWQDASVGIITTLLYSAVVDADVFTSWLSTPFATDRSTEHLLRVLYAYLDALGAESKLDGAAWINYIGGFVGVLVDGNISPTVRADAEACLRLLSRRIPGSSAAFNAAFKKRVKSLSKNAVPTPEALRLGSWLGKNTKDSKASLSVLLDQAVQWCIGVFGDSQSNPDLEETVNELANLITVSKAVDADVAQTLASVVIQNRLGDASALGLLAALLRSTPLKPLIVNRLLQSTIQHPHFFKACAGPTRTQVVNALHIIFNLHPTNTCQATHIQPLIRIYRGTCSTPDRQLLAILQLFETQRKISVASLFAQWSATEGSASSNALDALQTLDAVLVLRTCLHFPKWRTLELEAQAGFVAREQDAQLYDPVFVMLLFAQAMAEKVPESAFGWIETFRTNVVSLLIRALSCKDAKMREVARLQLAALWAHLEYADMQEQPHVVYVLNVLRNTLPPSDTDPKPTRRLPSYTTLLLAHAIRGIFYPSNFIYPLTARFLLQRPALDTTDVPMLYGMLYGSGDDWKKERGWIIRFISDGMMSTDDWRVLKRRHTWELLAELFQSSSDVSLRGSILEVLANLTCNAQATMSLILKTSLLHWIEMQLVASSTETALSWIKILENILLVADASKLESSTGAEWRSIICRCLLLVVTGATAKLRDIISLSASTLLRLASLPGPKPTALADLLAACLKGVQALESDLDVPSYRTTIRFSALSKRPPLPPHRALDLSTLDERDPLLRWGSTRNITRLDLACEGATDDLRQLLRAVPRVVTLRIWDDIPKRIGHAVNVLLDAKLLPHLADLEIICWLPKTAYPIILEILQDRFEAGLTRVYIDGLCRPLTQKRTMPGWRTWRRMLALVARGLDLNIRIEPDSVIPERDEWVHTLPFIPDGPSDYDSESESD
ncbi:hypothetical protein MKEN_00897000 [Mycena kentingensis (nom. inval.)]|nr:hypothetical protein MKEN_00897000 [Mycena kentingensis (nom. inval.)]